MKVGTNFLKNRSRIARVASLAALPLLALAAGLLSLPASAKSPHGITRDHISRAVARQMEKDLNRSVTVDIDTWEDYAVAGPDEGWRGRGVARIGNQYRDFTYDAVVRTGSAEIRKVKYGFPNGPAGAGDGEAHTQPHMREALRLLREAKNELEQASDTKGGHRGRAMEMMDKTIAEVRDGIDYDRTH